MDQKLALSQLSLMRFTHGDDIMLGQFRFWCRSAGYLHLHAASLRRYKRTRLVKRNKAQPLPEIAVNM